MDDGFFEASKGGYIGIDVKRIGVAVKPVEEGLIDEGLILEDYIWIAFGWGGNIGGLACSLEAAASECLGEDTPFDVVCLRLLTLLIYEVTSDPIHQNCSLLISFINDVNKLVLHSIGTSNLQAFVDHMKSLLSVEDGVEFEVGQVGVADHVDHRGLLTEAGSEGGEGCMREKVQVNSSLYS